MKKPSLNFIISRFESFLESMWRLCPVFVNGFRWTFNYPYFPSSLKTTISTFFLYFVTPSKKNHRLYLWLINSFPPHITHAFDSRSFLLSSYHASPISKLPTTLNSFIINIWHPKTPPTMGSLCCNLFFSPRTKKKQMPKKSKIYSEEKWKNNSSEKRMSERLEND